jgi:hypothetical protein
MGRPIPDHMASSDDAGKLDRGVARLIRRVATGVFTVVVGLLVLGAYALVSWSADMTGFAQVIVRLLAVMLGAGAITVGVLSLRSLARLLSDGDLPTR